jgi:hypothetical protein
MQFDVVLGEGISGMTRLICRTIKPDAGEAGAPVVLTERALPLAALAMEPVAGKERGTVDALFGPTGDDARLTYLRLPLDGKPAVGEWTLTAPKDPEGKMSPSDWTITPGLKGVPVVLARFGDRLMIHRLSEGSQWGTLAENAAQARHLRLEVLRIGALWAIWDDPAYGIQYRRLSP